MIVMLVHSVSPELVLKPPHHLTSIEYNAKDEYILGSGMQNGQLAFFDTRRGNSPFELSSMWTSHKDPVCRMIWIVSKTGNECMSAATDGQVQRTVIGLLHSNQSVSIVLKWSACIYPSVPSVTLVRATS